jgi:C-terminal processing protease CtpA/Prc
VHPGVRASWSPEDKIVKVAQGEEEPVDVVGMKLRKVVKLIRGPKGTEVPIDCAKAGRYQSSHPQSYAMSWNSKRPLPNPL